LTRCKLVGAHKLAIKTTYVLSFTRHNFNHPPEFIRKENKLQEEVELNTGSREKKGGVTRARGRGRGKMNRK
jgi:hypothetical protein